MKIAVGGKPFDGGDVTSLILNGQRQAGIDALAIHKDSAGATRALIAALLGSREAQIVAHEVKQRRADIRLDIDCFSIDDKMHKDISLG